MLELRRKTKMLQLNETNAAQNAFDRNKKQALNDLKIMGMTLVTLPKQVLDLFEALEIAVHNAPKDLTRINKGYSCIIDIPNHSLKILKTFGDNLVNSRVFKRYLFNPRLVAINLLYSAYDPKAVENPTHAHLWHRDRDDHGRGLKLMIPVTNCTADNGMFSALSAECVGFNNYLYDKKLIKKAEMYGDMGDDYKASDCVRLNDITIRSNFEGKVFDFQNSLGRALLVDTNLCYHKGGLVLKQGDYRIMIQLTFGSFTHSSLPRSGARTVLGWVRSKWNKTIRSFNLNNDI